MLGLTRTVAKEFGAFGIRCNCVTYGFIDTRLTQVSSLQGLHQALGLRDIYCALLLDVSDCAVCSVHQGACCSSSFRDARRYPDLQF